MSQRETWTNKKDRTFQGTVRRKEYAMKFAEVMLRNLDSKYKASHHVQMVLTRFGAEKPASLHGMTTVSVHWFGLCGLQPAEEKHIAPNNSVARQSRATTVGKFLWTLSISAANHGKDA